MRTLWLHHDKTKDRGMIIVALIGFYVLIYFPGNGSYPRKIIIVENTSFQSKALTHK